MKKIGKIGYIAIGSLFTLILGFSFYSFAEQSNNVVSSSNPTATTSDFDGYPTEIDIANNKITLFNGTKKAEFTLNADTIIYRDGQKTSLDKLQYTDDVKVTLNSEQVVRYIVATASNQNQTPKVQEQPANSPSETSISTPSQTQSTVAVRELQLHIDYGHGTNYEMTYHKDEHGKIESHIHKKTTGQNIEAKDQQATAFIESFLKQLALTPNSNQADILNKVQSVLGVKDNSFKNFEFKVKFVDNKEFHMHLDSNGHDKGR